MSDELQVQTPTGLQVQGVLHSSRMGVEILR